MNKLMISSYLLMVFFFSCGPQTQTNQNEEAMVEPEMTLQEVWATDSVFKTPESVLFDAERNVIYVSNVNQNPAEKDGNGFISKLSPQGEVMELEWVTGLSGPKGMGIHNGKLYVTDVDELVEIDIESGSISNRYNVESGSFLNDITVSDDGVVYFSGSQSNKIYQFKDGKVEVFMEENVGGPNGLLYVDGTLYALTNEDKNFKSIDPNSKSISNISSFEGHGDGIVQVSDSSYIISDWEGQVFYYDKGEMKTLLNTKDQEINAADIDYLKDQNLVVVPTFFDNRVVAYQLVEETNTASEAVQ